MGKGSKNWDPPTVTDEQQDDSSMMTTLNSSLHEKGQFTWEEIRRHSNKKDRWLVINNRVYDVTKWFKHPGGQMVLNHYAGQDATVRERLIKKKACHDGGVILFLSI